MSRRLFFVSALAATAAWSSAGCASDSLPRLGLALDATSVSGISSGAYMAGQIEVAHATKIVGAGLVAGGPFACAESEGSRKLPYWWNWPAGVMENYAQALGGCMKTDVPADGVDDPKKLVARAKELAASGGIDPLSALAGDKIYLFSGDEDRTVSRHVVEAAKAFYVDAGVPSANVTLKEAPGGHGFLTEHEGVDCQATEAPYVNNCSYDQAKDILSTIYGPLKTPATAPQGNFVVFDQTPFGSPDTDALAEEGVVYIPKDCAAHAGCRLHIALHGCLQNRIAVQDQFIKESGFARWADTNRLVVLFPQTGIAALEGCWDWWGYTGLDYFSKDAPQITAIWAMAQRLAEQPSH